MSPNEQVDNSEQVQESPETDLSSRERSMTEKGHEYHISQLEERFRATISSWRRQSNKLASVMTEANDTVTIRNHHDILQLSKVFESLQELKDDSSTEAGKFESVETDYQDGMLSVEQRIRALDSQKQEVSSNKSFHSAMSTSSRHSNVSRISDAAARKAALQAKLKCIDNVSKCKAQLQKIQTIKEMEMVGAEIDALAGGHLEVQETDSNVHIPFVKNESEDYVKEYVQSLGHPPCPIEVDVLVSEGNVTPSDLHGTSQFYSEEASSTTTLAVSVIDTVICL